MLLFFSSCKERNGGRIYSKFNISKNDINERFLDACENGDYPTVVFILENLRDFNIDVTDSLGRTALRLAVENEHLEVIFHIYRTFMIARDFKARRQKANLAYVIISNL